MPDSHYDIAIIGAGAAGLQLALAMRDEVFFSNKRIIILEKSGKDQNDRTWCFWEQNEGKWDHLLRHSWAKADFYTSAHSRQLELLPFRYKMLRSIDFYQYAKEQISKSPHFHWQNEEVQSVNQGEKLSIIGKSGKYRADYVFDSRIPEDFFNPNDKYTKLLQHFKGWVVRFSEDVFDPERFTMMDFRLLWPDSTSFTYVLPLSKREALIEFTLFSSELLQKEDYDKMLQKYLSEILQLKDFEIIEVEQGIIPMSDFPFHHYSKGRHIRIGTGGGWVKPSSGYSFKNCERYSQKIVSNMITGRAINEGLFPAKYRFYDAIFLDVLHRQNELGPQLFESMYLKNSVQSIFHFLDNQSSLSDDLKIIAGFPKGPFLRALGRWIGRWRRK